ncbi:MAG: hypothetical protein EOQ64_18895 [Mesorhizobium sp.]|uniref:hypothetical protein n=1 Tax=Mesorhizobium sp. TaxID=1871066 RepID=UPI000FE5CD45|nr:hypothetical protein [Mesorhizobium sp.]RWG54852.1 MAG: hypothetical protein EOQ64_18895 [Mesorhizobium sp.]
MMPGVAAQPLRRSSSGGGGIANAWNLDFLDEVYTLNGSPVLLADIVDKPERVGANGLEILDNDVNGSVSAIGALLTDLIAADWTAVVGFEKAASGGFSELLYVGDIDLNHSIFVDLYTSMQGGDSGFVIRPISNAGDYRSGVHKVAFTRTNAIAAISTDGGSAVADTTLNDTLNPMAIAAFGGLPSPDGSYDACYIRTFQLMAPVSTGALPSLSA